MKLSLIRAGLGATAVFGLVAFCVAPAHAIDNRQVASGDAIYTVSCDSDLANGQLLSINSAGFSAPVGIGTESNSDCSGQPAWDAATQTAYSIDYKGSSTLQKVDLSTGASEDVHAFELDNESIWVDALAISPSGKAFATIASNLYSVDLSDATLGLIGEMSTNSVYGLAFDPRQPNTLYGINSSSDLITINTATGESFPLASLTLTPNNDSYSLQVDTNGILWLENNGEDRNSSDMWSVDPSANDIAASAQLAYRFIFGESENYYTESVLIVPFGVVPVISTANHAAAVAGSLFSFTAHTTGTPTPVFSLTGALPAGITFDAETGELKGTPTTAGVYSFTLVSTSYAGTTSQEFTLTVTAAIVLPITAG